MPRTGGRLPVPNHTLLSSFPRPTPSLFSFRPLALPTPAGGNGWVDVEESASGLLGVLESGQQLNGRFLSFKGEDIPW